MILINTLVELYPIMDLTSIFLLCLISCVIGAILMLLVQYYAFVKYFEMPEATKEQKSINEKYLLPDVRIYIIRYGRRILSNI